MTMLDHISLGVRDIPRSRRFYDAVMVPLGCTRISDGETSLGYGRDSVFLWLGQTDKPVPADPDSGLHFCFTAPTRQAVAEFHAAAMACGGKDKGPAGLRPDYGDTYYAAFVIDPDGYRLEAYCGLPEGQQAATTYLGSQQALADLRALNARFVHNFVTRDVAGHDDLLHPAFTGIRSNGTRIGRADYLTMWATAFDPEVIIYWDTRDEEISVIGNVALVRATNREVIRTGDSEVASMSTYTDTYLYEAGRWRCIQAHITPVRPGFEPPDETIVSVYVKGVMQVRKG